jgi:putative DNA primase/helicase
MPPLDPTEKRHEVVDQSEEAIATRFISEHKGNLRYTPASGRWNVWDGQRWKDDETDKAGYTMAAFLRKFANERAQAVEGALRAADMDVKDIRARALRKVERFTSSAFRNAVMQRVKLDPRIVTAIDLWDGPESKMLLNTPDGTVDLRTGEIRRAAQEDYITKMAAVGPRSMPTPLWDKFLRRITNNDFQFMEYLQRVLGYCLTGVTTEQSFFFAYGTGANGSLYIYAPVQDIHRGQSQAGASLHRRVHLPPSPPDPIYSDHSKRGARYPSHRAPPP